MKGYKAFNRDLKCRDMQYQIGETYHTDEPIALCKRGFHFCRTLMETFKYYDKFDSRFCEVEAINVIAGDDKCVCSDIKILNELSRTEVNKCIYGDGDGDGDGDGYGDGNGNGYGDGDGDGNGDGDGYGDGNGYGDGYGDGNGYGNGNGYGYGNGYGNGYGDGNGNIQKILLF